jgi:hypothetical protein
MGGKERRAGCHQQFGAGRTLQPCQGRIYQWRKFMRRDLLMVMGLIANLCGCATPAVEPKQVFANGAPWSTHHAGDITVVSQPSWVQTYAVCANPDSSSAVSVFVRDRPSLRNIYETAPHLAPGQCVLASVDREQDLVLRQLGDGPEAGGKFLEVTGPGYRPPAPQLPLSVRIARFPHHLHDMGVR